MPDETKKISTGVKSPVDCCLSGERSGKMKRAKRATSITSHLSLLVKKL